MKHKMWVILPALLIIYGQQSFSQAEDVASQAEMFSTQIQFDKGETVPSTSALKFITAISPVGNLPDYFTGNIILGIGGIFSATIFYDNVFGTPIGRIIPSNNYEFRIVLRQQNINLPSISLFYQRMMVEKGGVFNDRDLEKDAISFYRRGLLYSTYRANNTLVGISLKTIFNNSVALSASIGLRDFKWIRPVGSYYVDDPMTMIRSYHQFSQSQQRDFRIYLSGAITYNVFGSLYINGMVQSYPILGVEPHSNFVMVLRDGYRSNAGIRYFISDTFNVEVYDQYVSGFIIIKSYHHMRLGVNYSMSLNRKH